MRDVTSTGFFATTAGCAADSDIEGLRKRLAIDQLRVALSRPTERLIWLDINPSDQIVRQSIAFLNGGEVESGVSSCVPAALLKTLEEDELDAEERVQRCQADARQYLASEAGNSLVARAAGGHAAWASRVRSQR